MGSRDGFLDRLKELSTADRDVEEIRPLIESARGESVRRKHLFNKLGHGTVPADLLDEGEQPHYFLWGSSIDVEGDGAGGESITGWDRDRRIGSAYTVITEQRVLVIASHLRGYDEHTIPYDSITSVNLNTGMISTRLTLQTRGATYHLSVSSSDDEEVQEAVEYLRERRLRGDESSANDGPLDRLEKLKSLYDDGAITEVEFENKKSDLLDDI
jgi:hypothetical protein